MSYRLELDPDVRRTLRKLTRADPQAAARIAKVLDQLAEELWPKGVKALAGASGLPRGRVGDYRIVCTVEDGRLVLLVLCIGHRRDVYR